MSADSAPGAAAALQGQSDRLSRYYEQAQVDYRFLWMNSRNLAFHFGYYEDGVQHHARALENANHVLAAMAGVKPGDRVLDAGCGLGGSACWLASQRGATVTGITLVQRQVDHARQIVARRRLGGKVAIERADYAGTPFPDASFDVVWALESLCHAPDKPAFYREAMRLLRPGGRLVVAEYIRAARGLAPQDERLVREWLDGWMIPDLATREEHIAAAMASGFPDAELADHTHRTHRSLRRLHRLARLAAPFDALFHKTGLRSPAQHGNVVASLRQYEALCRNAWFYGILTAVKPC